MLGKHSDTPKYGSESLRPSVEITDDTPECSRVEKLKFRSHTKPVQSRDEGGAAVIGFAAPPLTGKLGLSAQLSDEDITLTATLGEDQLVSWMPLIKLWSCHRHAATATASCYLCHLSLAASAHSTAWGGGGAMMNEGWAALLKQMPAPHLLDLERSDKHFPGALWFRAKLELNTSVLAVSVMGHLIKALT